MSENSANRSILGCDEAEGLKNSSDLGEASIRDRAEEVGEKGKKEDVSSTDWRKFFNASADQTLKFFPPQPLNGKSIVVPLSEVFEEGEQKWKYAVVAQFVGRIPNFSVFQKKVNLLWGEDGEIDIKPAGHNLFILHFPNSRVRDRVIESGPWHIQNKPLIVRRWEPGMRSLEFDMTKLPLWIHLGNIPLELFTQTGISYIASALGNPLYMDRFTANQQRLAFAKVCIEVEASRDIPRSIEVQLKDGSIGLVHVEIPWMPTKCVQCGIFGHGDKTCPKKLQPRKAWVPKVVEKKNEDPLENKNMQQQGLEKVETIQVEEKREEKKNETPPSKIAVGMGKSGSVNRFAILKTIDEKAEEEIMVSETMPMMEEEIQMEPRKARAAAAGVADLMKSLKTRRKGPIDKGKVKQGKAGSPALGGTHSSPSL